MSDALNAEVARLARDGWTVSSVTDGQAIVQRKARLNWILHVLLSVLTGGLWLIVVAVLVINRRVESRVVTVDQVTGKVLVR